MEAHAARPPALAAEARSPRLVRFASDERLVELVRDGHPAAFEVMYDRHSKGILSFCRHMLGQREEAEDAVQHTFLAAYNDLRRSDKPIQLRAWLYAIARNRCLSMLRARREQPSEDIELVSVEGLSDQVQRRQDLQDLLRDLSALPDDQRAALVLAELGALSHDEIAEALDVRRDKVKALVFQARESLMASRSARDTPCHEIREQLATLRGGSLRRTTLRRHLRDCQGCREYKAQVDRQRKALALALPVVPTAALKASTLTAALGGGAAMGAAGGAAVGGTASIGLIAAVKGLSAQALAVLAVAGVAGTAGTVVAVNHITSDGHSGTHHRAAPAAPGRAHGATPATPATPGVSRATPATPAGQALRHRRAGAGAAGGACGATGHGRRVRAHGKAGAPGQTVHGAPGEGTTSAPGHSGTAPGKTKTTAGGSGTGTAIPTSHGHSQSTSHGNGGSTTSGRSSTAPGQTGVHGSNNGVGSTHSQSPNVHPTHPSTGVGNGGTAGNSGSSNGTSGTGTTGNNGNGNANGHTLTTPAPPPPPPTSNAGGNGNGPHTSTTSAGSLLGG